MSFIIFIGNITSGSFSLMGDKSSVLHVKHMKTKINIPADEKFFLKVNLKQNAQEIIKFNLKKYHDDIVEGEFPLEFINLEFFIWNLFLEKSRCFLCRTLPFFKIAFRLRGTSKREILHFQQTIYRAGIFFFS